MPLNTAGRGITKGRMGVDAAPAVVGVVDIIAPPTAGVAAAAMRAVLAMSAR
jgi:hypothetical protein